MIPEDALELIHPSLALASYVFVIINSIYTFTKGKKENQKITIQIAWLFCLGGLITGMVWAELAWGRFWNWDPKEIGTLLLLVSITAYILIFNKPKMNHKRLFLLTCTNLIFMFFTLIMSPAMDSIHSDYLPLAVLMR